jgi:hypothetical protein
MFVRGHASNLKNVEIFYLLNPKNDTIEEDALNISELQNELYRLTEIDYTKDETKVVKIPIDCRKMRLAIRFF